MEGGIQVNPDYSDWRSITEGARELILKMIAVAPEDRITAEEALEHPWIWERERVASAHIREDAHQRLGIFNQQRAERRMRAAITAVSNKHDHYEFSISFLLRVVPSWSAWKWQKLVLSVA